jgi:hypothetical protein
VKAPGRQATSRDIDEHKPSQHGDAVSWRAISEGHFYINRFASVVPHGRDRLWAVFVFGVARSFASGH